MLDRSKIIKEIGQFSEQIFSQDDNRIELAFLKWKEVLQDPNFQSRVVKSQSSFLLPSWQSNLGQVKQIKFVPNQHYTVLAVDGSQIYPERHISGINCFLINVGQVLLEYADKSKVVFSSDPKVFIPDQEGFSPDLVDLKREELELKSALTRARALVNEYKQKNIPIIVFIDGTLIFWVLESKPIETKKYFLAQYLEALDGFYKLGVPVAGYISMPKSCELVNLTKIGFCRFDHANCIGCHSRYTAFPCKDVDGVYDTQLCAQFLDTHYRTGVFRSNSNITELYPEHLKPCFCYLNVGTEIIRLEVPNWMAIDEKLIDQVCSMAVDQSIKGFGYPIALAEAHEQAVIKGSDRDFFYQILYKKSFDLKRRIILSPKSLKKRSIGI